MEHPPVLMTENARDDSVDNAAWKKLIPGKFSSQFEKDCMDTEEKIIQKGLSLLKENWALCIQRR